MQKGDIVYGSYDANGENWTPNNELTAANAVKQYPAQGETSATGANITYSKTAAKAEGDNTYDITLNVTATAKKTAVALIIDASYASQYCAECGKAPRESHKEECGFKDSADYNPNEITYAQSFLKAEKDAAKAFVETYAGSVNGAGRYVQIVSYQGTAAAHGTWYDVSTADGKTAAIAAIDDVVYYLTVETADKKNLQQGLKKAYDCFADNTVNKADKYAIVMTNSWPNAYTEGGVIKCDNWLASETYGVADEMRDDYNCTVFTAANANTEPYQNSYREQFDKLLKNIANEGCAYEGIRANVSGNVSWLNNTLAKDIIGKLNLTSGFTVTDPMGKYMQLLDSSLTDCLINNNTIVWTPSTGKATDNNNGSVTVSCTLTYKVKVNTNGDGFKYDNWYATNGDTLLKIDGEDETLHFNVPGVMVKYIPKDWNIPVSKTATVLTKDADGNYKTDVTLSLITRNDIDETSRIGVGSTIVDKIGKDFKLVDSDNIVINTIREIDGYSVDLKHVKVPGENGAWTSYFGQDRPDGSMVVGADYYMFMLTYDGKDTLKLTFNDWWGDGNVISMTYALQLIQPKTKAGTYGQLDLNGNSYIDGEDGNDTETKVDPDKALYTNEYATLTPVDSDGHENLPVKFPMPSVEYTVKNPYRPPVNPGIGDEITVEITGSSDSVVYDGTEHSVKGYTVKISDPRYTEADFTFTGKAEASGVNAGTYEMGLKAEQFKNTNARFTNVKFVIKADGVLTITPKELIITAGSKTEYGPTPVTCGEWTVSGLAAGDKVESVKITGIQSVPGSSPNVPSDAVIKNAKGEDVTKNYAIKYVNGTLTMLEVLNKEDHFNYIIGTPEGLSLPTANVTRAEVATIFFRLMTDDARAKFDSLDNNFSDVAKGKWYNRAISTLAKAGIIKGDPAGTYRPGDPITRAEMAAIIARFGDFKEGGKTFNDISGHWAQKYIELAASNGWINGNPDGTFKPNNNITRAETVAMINRVLDRQTKDVSDLLPVAQMTNWSDNMDTAKWYYRDMQEATNNHKAERVGNSIYEKWTEKLPDIDWASYQI